MIKIWNGEHLGKTVAIDTETTLIDKNNPGQTPRVLTIQAYGDTHESFFIRPKEYHLFADIHNTCNIIMHNAAFDTSVLEKLGVDFTEAIEADRIKDTSILYRLLHLAQVGWVPFKYNLALLASRFVGMELNKDEAVRLHFEDHCDESGEIDPENLPEDFAKYALEDAIATYKVYRYLTDEITKTGSETELSHQIQLIGDMALNKIYRNGIGFDVVARDKLFVEINKELEKCADRLAIWGWVRGQKGIDARFDKMCETWNIKPPKTTKGNRSQKEEDIIKYAEKVPWISDYIQFGKLEKTKSFVDKINTPRVHPRYTTILNTGRTSCQSPNVQQLPRAHGIRELFIPSEGCEFYIIDYSQLELCTLAQTCIDRFGESVMADLINEGVDLHKAYAAKLFDIPIEEVNKGQRQYAKAANFGFPGGLGTRTFRSYAWKSYGVEVSEEYAKQMKNIWFSTFPEMGKYMWVPQGASKMSCTTSTGRIRGGASFCASKNTPFQGLASDGFKIALWNLTKAGFKIVAEIHDEIIIEQPKHVDRFEEACIIMISSMRMVTPDVTIKVEGHKLNRWEKM